MSAGEIQGSLPPRALLDQWRMRNSGQPFDEKAAERILEKNAGVLESRIEKLVNFLENPQE